MKPIPNTHAATPAPVVPPAVTPAPAAPPAEPPKPADRMVRAINVCTRAITEGGKTYQPGEALELTPARAEEYKQRLIIPRDDKHAAEIRGWLKERKAPISNRKL